jgi:RND family efflux transporter MFP subunit
MTTPSSDSPAHANPRKRGLAMARFLFSLVFGVILPIVVLGVGIQITRQLMATPPKAGKGADVEIQGRLVEVEYLGADNRTVEVSAQGLVIPSREVNLQPLVGGELIELHPELLPGGVFNAGEVIARIDPRDFEYVVRQREAAVEQARSAVEVEMGQQKVAEEEFKLLGQEISEDDRRLVLREPQLDSAKANLQAAEAQLNQAKLDLERTAIIAPFQGLVLEESVEVGRVVGINTTVAVLVGTESFWVEVNTPLDDLRWVQLPDVNGEGGSVVRVRDEASWPRGAFREGRVVRFTNSVNAQSRMASLLVEVRDPLALQPENKALPKLLLNGYVRVDIQGRTMPNTVAIKREHLHNGNEVWIKNEEDRLDIRELEIAWRGRDVVYVERGVVAGERIITTSLSTPVENMLLRVRETIQQTEPTVEVQEALTTDAPVPVQPTPRSGG